MDSQERAKTCVDYIKEIGGVPVMVRIPSKDGTIFDGIRVIQESNAHYNDLLGVFLATRGVSLEMFRRLWT